MSNKVARGSDAAKRILIAEDDNISRRLLSASLQKWGYELTVACDGTEAVAAFQADPDISMAILDWMMPGMEGPEVCRHIKGARNQSFTYVIMLTAMTAKEDIVKALSTGADDYIAKPWDASELEARIRAGFRIIELETSLRKKILHLENALEQVEQLKGILPICAWCKKIRDDSDYWHSVEEYVEKYSRATFSHGICPDCVDSMATAE